MASSVSSGNCTARAAAPAQWSSHPDCRLAEERIIRRVQADAAKAGLPVDMAAGTNRSEWL
jgi:hypothetical protein